MDKDIENDEKTADKSKTPMWRINQLARYHKIKPVYKLEKEEGGRIKKVTMSLTLDKDVYYGCANTRKQAQQSAANNALKNTSLSYVAANKKKTAINPNALTATVKLNGWAMTHKKKVQYTVTCKKYPPQIAHYNRQQQQLLANPIVIPEYANSFQNLYSGNVYSIPGMPLTDEFSDFQHYQYSWNRPRHFSVCVEVGDKKFFGEGHTQQAARHNAAENALSSLSSCSSPENQNSDPDEESLKKESGKSSICLLHEHASPHNMSVVFNLLGESGPAHLKCYTVEVIVGHFVDQNLNEKLPHFRAIVSDMSKKSAKQAACSKVLEEIKKLPTPGKKVDNPLKKSSAKPLSTHLHPVSRLLQICQAQKIKEPIYTVDESDEKHGKTKFVIRCALQDKSVSGCGKSKKDAKKLAAIAMLTELNEQFNSLKTTVPNKDMAPQKSIMKIHDNEKGLTKRLQVKFNDSTASV